MEALIACHLSLMCTVCSGHMFCDPLRCHLLSLVAINKVLANVAHFVTIVVPDRVMTCRVRYQVGSIYWLSKRAKSQARLNS
jgi:hypothetical protein